MLLDRYSVVTLGYVGRDGNAKRSSCGNFRSSSYTSMTNLRDSCHASNFSN